MLRKVTGAALILLLMTQVIFAQGNSDSTPFRPGLDLKNDQPSRTKEQKEYDKALDRAYQSKLKEIPDAKKKDPFGGYPSNSTSGGQQTINNMAKLNGLCCSVATRGKRLPSLTNLPKLEDIVFPFGNLSALSSFVAQSLQRTEERCGADAFAPLCRIRNSPQRPSGSGWPLSSYAVERQATLA
jgi:hypothetical protein